MKTPVISVASVQWLPVSFTLISLWETLTLDHTDVIGTISNSQRHCVFVLLDKFHNLSFLERCDSATDHRLAHACSPQELQLHVLLQSISLNRECWEKVREMCCFPEKCPQDENEIIFGQKNKVLLPDCGRLLPVHTRHQPSRPPPLEIFFPEVCSWQWVVHLLTWVTSFSGHSWMISQYKSVNRTSSLWWRWFGKWREMTLTQAPLALLLLCWWLLWRHLSSLLWAYYRNNQCSQPSLWDIVTVIKM